jgi:hypothetical protein
VADPREIDRIVAAWIALDRARALLPADRELAESAAAPRALVVERLLATGFGRSRGEPTPVGPRPNDDHSDRDLFHACAMLGRLLAEHGASPTMAAATIDGANEALGGVGAAGWVVPARAALAEAYAAALLEKTRAEGAGAWEPPRCIVQIDEKTVAVAAGYPSDDGEALAAWAERVAAAARRGGARKAVIAGSEAAAQALAEAFGFAGIEVVLSAEPLKKRGFRLPWRRG